MTDSQPPARRHPPRKGDLTIDELYQQAVPLLFATKPSLVYMKWTCPSCGERVSSDDPLYVNSQNQVVVPSSLLHTTKDDDSPCMISVSTTDPDSRFGYLVIMSAHPDTIRINGQN